MDVTRRRRAGEREVLARRHLPAWHAGGVDAAVLTVASDESTATALTAYALEAIHHLTDDIADRPDQLGLVTSAAQLLIERSRGRFAILLNIEGARPLEGSLAKLDRFYQAGVRFMTLTWNTRNEAGTGVACSPAEGGLTLFGRQLLQAMADLGMVADLSHASPATFWDAVREDPGNLVVTHSNAAGLHPHVRNLTDEQIRAIVAQGGYVGVCFFPGFLHSPRPTVDHVVDHIAYIADLVGIDYVAIGADYIEYALEEMIEHLRTSGVAYGTNFTYPAGVESVHTLGNLTRAMIRRGFNGEEVVKVLGGNLVNVISRVVDDRGVC